MEAPIERHTGRRVAIAALGGIAGTACTGWLAFYALPKPAGEWWLSVGVPFGWVLSKIVPAPARYWIDGNGGPISFLGFAILGALLTWTLLIGGAIWWYLRGR